MSAKNIMKTALGIIAIIFGLLALNIYHHLLWSSGGPDGNRSQLQYIIPYFLTSAIATLGFVGIWQGIRSFKKSK